jgi:hypothetical protein
MSHNSFDKDAIVFLSLNFLIKTLSKSSQLVTEPGGTIKYHVDALPEKV